LYHIFNVLRVKDIKTCNKSVPMQPGISGGSALLAIQDYRENSGIFISGVWLPAYEHPGWPAVYTIKAAQPERF
jgi:hypothetical protein